MPKSHNCRLVPPKQLHQWMQAGKIIYLIDTLGSDHFCKVRLPKATNACVFAVTFVDQVKAITPEKNATIILYGSSARSMDAFKAAEKLAQEGYSDIYAVEGGIEAWRAAGLPLHGDAVDEPDDPQTLLQLENRSYQIDTENSSIEWRGRNTNSTHYGSVQIACGKLAVQDGCFSGTFDIDMNSITNNDLEGDPLQPVLITHLKSDDFFLTHFFPTATFTILHGVPIQEPYLTIPNCAISGRFMLRGITAEQNFMATVTTTSENGLVAEAHFDIDRTRWNIIYGSTRFFEHLGMHRVFDPISIQLRIVAS